MAEGHPSEGQRTAIDRFSDRAANLASKAPLWVIVFMLIAAWVLATVMEAHAVALILVSAFEILTLCLVVILQNSERRTEGALNRKLDATLEALAVMVEDRSEDLAAELRSSKELEQKT